MSEETCNADVKANELLASLSSGLPTPPTIDFSDAKYSYTQDPLLYTEVNDITLDDLTTVALDGTGIFDKLMGAVDLHIQREFKSNRITADQYAEVYAQSISNVLSTSVSFLLNKDQSKWNGITAQMQARRSSIENVTAQIELETAKFNTAKTVYDTQNANAQYGLTKIEIANADAQHCLIQAQTSSEVYREKYLLPAELAIQEYQRSSVLPSNVEINKVQYQRILPAQADASEYNVKTVLPAKVAIDEAQKNSIVATTNISAYELASILPAQLAQTTKATEVAEAQKLQIESDTDLNEYQLASILPSELNINIAKKEELEASTDISEYQLTNLLPITLSMETYKRDTDMPIGTNILSEQYERERAQTLNTRSDGTTPVTGLIGTQRALILEQQEAERAKTMDTRIDGSTTIVGSIGKQKDLYTQQIDSFVKDAKYKTAKMYLDAWITQKTLDDALLAPSELQNSEINNVMESIRDANGLGTP